MPVLRIIVSLILCALFVTAPAAYAQEKPAGGPESKWGPNVGVEGTLGLKRNLGEADFFIPVFQNERTLLFMNLRGRFDDHDAREGNFGLGVRRMLESGWNLGGYAYYDRRRSETGNDYNQVTLGAEALGHNWDFRVNGYIPVGSRVQDLGTTGGDTTASISGTTVQVTTAGTTTREERALYGFDGEAGWRTPLFKAENPWQFRLFAGGYYFDDGVSRLGGPRARAEFSLDDVPWFGRGSRLALGAEVQNDSVRGGQAFVSVRLSIPFGGGSKRTPLSAQERRMTEPVRRDVDIVTDNRVSATTPTVVETAAVTSSGQAITVVSSSTTPGPGLQAALNAAGANSTVILSGSFNTAGAITTLQAGQTVMGAGSLTVRTPSGRTAVLTTPAATIRGDVGMSNYTIVMANNSTLAGMNITNIDATGNNALGIRADGVSGARIMNNTVSATQTGGGFATAHGIDILNGAGNILVSGNTVTATDQVGGGLALALQLFNAGATVTGNSLSATCPAGTSYAVKLTDATIGAGSTDNVRINGILNNAGVSTGSIFFTDGSHIP